jgi:dolichol-phosphate mannosyltransferase
MARRAAVDSASAIEYSVIVPAYHEVLNIKPLTVRLFAALAKGEHAHANALNTELIIVDDNSKDGSAEAVGALAESYNVRIIVRTTERGLASAVVRGFKEARGDKMLCMDADLQHPPESVPALLRALTDPATPFVLGTRYAAGVEMDKNWPLYRQIISAGARSLALLLTPASDPMSGFFGIRKKEFGIALGRGINPASFKVALDVLVKADIQRSQIAEVGFSFGTRVEGESKLSSKVMLKYLGTFLQLVILLLRVF